MNKSHYSDVFIIVLLVAVFFAACATGGGRIAPLLPGETCLGKLEGTWEGYVQAANSAKWANGGGRTLILYLVGERLTGVFGARSLGLLPIDPEMQIFEDCKMKISFVAAPGVSTSRVELLFNQDGHLDGYYIIPTIYPIPFTLEKE